MFKVGDIVWHVIKGPVTLVACDPVDAMSRAKPISDGELCYYESGFKNKSDAFKTLYSLQEAKVMGFPVPELPMTLWRVEEEGSAMWSVYDNYSVVQSRIARNPSAKIRKFVEVL